MVLRQTNWLGQMRVDVPHLRAMESSVAADFDVLAGQMMAGKKGVVLAGFNVITTGAIGSQASSLQVSVNGGLLMHYLATESGSLYSVPAGRSPELLAASNPKVTGSFTASQTNYVGLDLTRSEDESTADVVKFRDATTKKEFSKTVPLARTLDYRLVISTSNFASQGTVLPLAQVVTDASNNVVSITDARQLMFRLGSGGDFPSSTYSYSWASRLENSTGDIFAGGDKGLASLKDWMDASMTRIWELGGGERWFSASADRNVLMVWTGTPFSGGENFEWDGTHLHWKGLKFVFANSTGYNNTVSDQTSNSAGLTDLADGDCLYLDLVRGSNATVAAHKGTLATLTAPTIPGSRQVIAYRLGSAVYTRGSRTAVGAGSPVATTTSLGIVKLSHAATTPASPIVMSDGGSNAPLGFVGLDADGSAYIMPTTNTLGSTALNIIQQGNNPDAPTIGILVSPGGSDSPGMTGIDSSGNQGGGGVVGRAGANNGAFGVAGYGGGYHTSGTAYALPAVLGQSTIARGNGVQGIGEGASMPGDTLIYNAGVFGLGGGSGGEEGYGGVFYGASTKPGSYSKGGSGDTSGAIGQGTALGAGVVGYGDTNSTSTSGPTAATFTAGPGTGMVGIGATGTDGGDGANFFGQATSIQRSGIWAAGNTPSVGNVAGGYGAKLFGGNGHGTSGGGTGLLAQGGTGAGGGGTGIEATGGASGGLAAAFTAGSGNTDAVQAAASGAGYAFKSTAGSMGVPSTKDYEYTSAVTRSIFVTADEMEIDTTSNAWKIGAGGGVGTTVMKNNFTGTPPVGGSIWGRMKVPAGVTVTDVKIYIYNNDGGTRTFAMGIYVAKYLSSASGNSGGVSADGSSSGNPTRVDDTVGTPISATNATGAWYTVTLTGSFTAPSDGYISFSIAESGTDSVGSTGTILIGAIRVSYTQTALKPAI
jgi:hypothetical protein